MRACPSRGNYRLGSAGALLGGWRSSRPFGVEPIRLHKSHWIQRQNGIECWTFTIICCNSIEIGLDDLPARPDIGLQRPLNVDDRRLLYNKVLSWRLACI